MGIDDNGAGALHQQRATCPQNRDARKADRAAADRDPSKMINNKLYLLEPLALALLTLDRLYPDGCHHPREVRRMVHQILLTQSYAIQSDDIRLKRSEDPE
jgi:hypothetical protein